MTKNEAIEIIKENFPKRCRMVDGRMQGGFDDTESEHGKALLLAIAALETDGDLISRQAVFNTMKDVFREYNIGFRPGETGRGFASAVPQAIADIPAVHSASDALVVSAERQCVKQREQLPSREEFQQVLKPVISWLQRNGCPHERIIVEYDGAELVSGEMAFSVEIPD